MRRHTLIALALCLLAVACGGSNDTPTQPPHATNKTVDVFTIGTGFSPPIATIAAGDTVRWHFQAASDGLGHNVDFVKGVAGTPADIGTDFHNGLTKDSVSRVFTIAGTFQYSCTLHGSMLGTVLVQ